MIIAIEILIIVSLLIIVAFTTSLIISYAEHIKKTKYVVEDFNCKYGYAKYKTFKKFADKIPWRAVYDDDKERYFLWCGAESGWHYRSGAAIHQENYISNSIIILNGTCMILKTLVGYFLAMLYMRKILKRENARKLFNWN